MLLSSAPNCINLFPNGHNHGTCLVVLQNHYFKSREFNQTMKIIIIE